jgi:predicted dinucleotide-binding enzyme
MRIGIIGSGNIGGTLGPLWAKAGHEVLYSSRHPEQLASLVARSGPQAHAGTVEEAAQFGNVVLLAVPFGSVPQLGHTLTPLLKMKVVIDASNPYPERDGEMARHVIESGSGMGVATAGYLPGTRVVRAFNTVWSKTMEREAGRAGDRVGIPLAADDASALEIASTLVRDAGFEPVTVGKLRDSVKFDVGSVVYNSGMSGTELRQAFGME